MTARPHPASRIAVLLRLGLLVAAALPATAAGWSPGEPVPLEEVGAGDLLWRTDAGYVPLPVLTVDVAVDVDGPLVTGRLSQRFVNPTDRAIEALYVFPLPARARLHHMTLRVGDRTIRAEVQERTAARRIYERARESGRTAALVASRPRTDLFSTRVANIPPGVPVEVELGWLDVLEPDDGVWQLRVPLTYVPRYGVSDVPDPHPREPPVRIGVTLRAGLPIDGLRSPSHEIAVGEGARGDRFVATPTDRPAPADADFVLEWRVRADRRPAPFVVLQTADDATYATAIVWPPRGSDVDDHGLTTDTLFVVDVSGSMRGPSIDQAGAALVSALRRLRPGDRFNVVAFNQATATLFDVSRAATRGAVDDAIRWVDGLAAHGGTEIHGALAHALDLYDATPGDAERRIVLLTDGAVGRSDLLLEEMSRRLGATRLHTIGIGHAPNARLLEALASLGRGTTAFIDSTTDVAAGVDRFFRRLERPVVSDLELAWHGLHPDRVAPERIPDVYDGRPLRVHVRLHDPLPDGQLVIRGRLPSGPVSLRVPIDHTTPRAVGLDTRWAAARIDGLLESLVAGAAPELVREQVVALGVRHGVVTPYTSLVAVDDRRADSLSRRGASSSAALPLGGSAGPLRRLVAAWIGVVGLALVLATGFWRPRCDV